MKTRFISEQSLHTDEEEQAFLRFSFHIKYL